ncbi:MAG: AAA family ATPase [Rhodocyclaceae bacterium]|nr:AAA family ATPase [Rhodocyclaceae bacterium]MDZ4216114.1 AAA family ATPase [Rhodocyclaceae bacterium]
MNAPANVLSALPAIERCIETHISWVLLADEFAWKIKKPVVLPFLDYGTVDKRRACCEEELRLNRRFAPQLYLEVVELNGEPAVKMRRFDEALRLDHVCANCDLTGAQLSAFARDLSDFQAAVPPAPTFGTPETILADALENFEELERLLPDAVGHLARLKQWTQAEFTRRHSDFVCRKAQGKIREGHGDLHLGNLVLLNGRIVPFDGIEFNAGFRHIDVASEIAFTLLDLLDHQRPGLATWLLSEWLTYSGDFDALTVLRFYLVYRALVRAKVAALQENRDGSLAYLSFALRLTTLTAPTLTITCGLSGSGKTYLSSRRLASADFLQTVRIRSDVERKRLHGLPADADSGGTIYGPAATLRTYAHLAELAERALRAGWSVIVDAAFLKRAERAAFASLASALGVGFAILAPEASPETCAARLATRQGDASEATPAVLAAQLQWFEPVTPDEVIDPDCMPSPVTSCGQKP